MSLFDRPPNATDDIHLVASYQKHFDRFLAHLRALNKLLEEYDEHCIGFLHEAAIHFCRQQHALAINNNKGTCYEDGIGCALELCVVGTPMPKAIPSFAVCCAALLTDDDEWSNPGVMHLLVVDMADGNSKVLDPLADFERLPLTRNLDSQFPRSDPRRYSRSSLYVSGSCPTLNATGCLVDASANHRALLRQHQLDTVQQRQQQQQQSGEREPASSHRAAKLLPYSSTILVGNYTLTRLGADKTLSNEEKKISPGSPGDAAYQKNVAVCGPQGFGFYARGAFRNPFHFLSMVTGKKEKVLQLPGYQSAVLSNPRNLEQIITLGPKSNMDNTTQLHLVSTAGAEPELVDTIDILKKEKSDSNGFVSTALCCHDADNSIVFVVYGTYTAVVRNVPWLSRDWKQGKTDARQ